MKTIFTIQLFVLFIASNMNAQWTTGADIPEGIRAGNTISHLEDGSSYVYLFGGRNDQEIISNKTYRYRFADNSWETMTDVPTPILGSSVAKVENSIYIIGGMVTTPGTVTKKVYKYLISEDSWSEAADTPLPYTDGDAVAYQDSLIYTVGSYNSEKTFVYNTITNKWREGNSVPSPGFALSYGALSVYDNKLIYVGGSNGTFSTTYWNTTWIGEIDQNDRSQITWTQGTPFPGETRTFFELQPWANGLILIGGTTDNTFDTFTDESYFYNAENNSWTELPSKPTAWNTGNAASLFLDNAWKLFCTGGFASEYLFETEIYTQENLATSNADDTDLCHLKYMRTIGGKNPKVSFCTNENGKIGMKIWDGQGRLVREKQSIAQNAGKHLISIEELNLPAGIYLITLSQNGFNQTKKIQIF